MLAPVCPEAKIHRITNGSPMFPQTMSRHIMRSGIGRCTKVSTELGESARPLFWKAETVR